MQPSCRLHGNRREAIWKGVYLCRRKPIYQPLIQSLMNIQKLRKLLLELNLDTEVRPNLIYVFYMNEGGVINSFSISASRAKTFQRRFMNDAELVEVMQGYPDAKNARILAVERPDKGLTRWMEQHDVCHRLKTSRHSLYRWRRRGLLHPSRLGNRLYYDAEEVERLLVSNIIDENGRIVKGEK